MNVILTLYSATKRLITSYQGTFFLKQNAQYLKTIFLRFLICNDVCKFSVFFLTKSEQSLKSVSFHVMDNKTYAYAKLKENARKIKISNVFFHNTSY